MALAYRGISVRPGPLRPLTSSTLFQVSPTTTPSSGAPFASMILMKMIWFPCPLLSQPFSSLGHKRHEASRKSMLGVEVGGGRGVGVGGAGVGVSVGVGDGEGVKVAVGVDVGVGVGVRVLVGTGVGDGVAVLVADGGTGVAVGIGCAVGAEVAVEAGPGSVAASGCRASGVEELHAVNRLVRSRKRGARIKSVLRFFMAQIIHALADPRTWCIQKDTFGAGRPNPDLT